MENILAVLYGLVFGIANIIPGVSGGTMLVVFGCYDKVCGALTFNLKEIKKNLVFLIFFGIGAVGGIFGFSFVITALFANFPIQTNLFFMGLIVGSVPLIIRNATVKDKFGAKCILPFIIGLAAVVGLTVWQNSSSSGDPFMIDTTVNGNASYVDLKNTSDRTVNKWTVELKEYGVREDRITAEDAEISCEKSLSKELKLLFSGSDSAASPNKITITGSFPPGSVCSFSYNNDGEPMIFEKDNISVNTGYAMDIGFFLWLMFAMFIAAVAMIIPGVSGSFIMVTLGTYSTAIGAIKALDIITLIPVAAGAVLGIVLGARLVTFLMKKFRLITFSVILGLVAGSIYAILPAGFGLNAATLTGIIALAAGGAVSLLVGKNTKVEE